MTNHIENEPFDYGDATAAQKEAARSTEGPLLITAGPGTGKTKTLVLRVMYLIQKLGVEPASIMVATYTEKAAKELLARISNEALQRGLDINCQDMYLGTFHSICLRLLTENAERSNLPKNFGVADEFGQKYRVFLETKLFNGIEGLEEVGAWNKKYPDYWKRAGQVIGMADRLIEEQVSLDDLSRDSNKRIAAVGTASKTYFELMGSRGLLDFAMLQVRAYDLLSDNPSVLAKVRERIRYVMVDEYQDTNHVQEQLAFLIAGDRGNICVVGDDDQSLYRFRGATVRNILQFEHRFPQGCKKVSLQTNFRSNPQIVDFYRRWIEGTRCAPSEYSFDWGGCRLDKRVTACDRPRTPWPADGKAVVKLTSGSDRTEWHERVYRFIADLKESGKITDYNQVAVLFASVASPAWKQSERSDAPQLARYLEERGIRVFSPRSGAFYSRNEVRLALGVLMHVFPSAKDTGLKTRPDYWKQDIYEYLKECFDYAANMMEDRRCEQLRAWAEAKCAEHRLLKGTADHALAELAYQMLAFWPFSNVLDRDLGASAYDVRPLHNLSIIVSTLVTFQETYGIKVLRGERLDDTLQKFARFLGRNRADRVDEHEDEIEVLPSGCVTFMTIHQAKGMEFPVTIVDTSEAQPWGTQDETLQDIVRTYGSGLDDEPEQHIAKFDFWRKYYVAFSRAQDLLVLTNGAPIGQANDCFQWLYDELDEANSEDYVKPEWRFHKVKGADIKQAYSFTSHVNVYDTCPRQYKFHKELKFPGVRTAATLFGSVVHQTIEDVHKAVLRGEAESVTDDAIDRWFASNYASLSTLHREYLQKGQQAAALNQVKRYVARRNGDWSDIREAEVKVDFVSEGYIITGNVDLIQGEGDTLELVDFKSEQPAKLKSHPDRIERYRKQLQLYSFLVEAQDPLRKVSRVRLYCTGAAQDENPWITFERDAAAVESVVAGFDETVRKIEKKDFSCGTTDRKVCQECDFRWYCGKQVTS